MVSLLAIAVPVLSALTQRVGQVAEVRQSDSGASEQRLWALGVGKRFCAVRFLVLAPVLLQAFLLVRRFSDWLPVWAWYADPGYQYLLAGGAITSGDTPHHNDHPGTSFQWLVGILARLLHLLLGSGAPFAMDLIARPEFYAFGIGIALAILYVAALAYVSLRFLSSFGWVASLVFQLSLLWGTSVMAAGRYLLWPESLVITSGLMALGILAPLISRSRTALSTRETVALAAVCAIGVTAKIVFLPMILVSILVLNRRNVLTFFGTFSLGTILVLATVYLRWGYMWDWFSGIFSSGNRHGQEATATPIENVVFSFAVLQGNVRWLALVSSLIIAAAIGLVIAGHRIGFVSRRRSVFAILAGLATVGIFSLKDAQPRDFVAGIILLAALAALVVLMASEVLGRQYRVPLAALSVSVFAFLAAHGLVGSEYQYRDVAAQVRMVEERATALSGGLENAPRAVAYNVWTQDSALAYALQSTPYSFQREFRRLNIPLQYYDIFRGGVVGVRSDGKFDLLTCEELKDFGQSREFAILVETPLHLDRLLDGQRLRINGAVVDVLGNERVADYYVYKVTNIQCEEPSPSAD